MPIELRLMGVVAFGLLAVTAGLLQGGLLCKIVFVASVVVSVWFLAYLVVGAVYG